jgi:outer membrane biosynthesis protein TonB
MRRSRLGWAGLISLLLHAALLAWLWERAPARPVSPPPMVPALAVEIISLPPKPPPPPAPEPPPARPRPRTPAPPPAPLPSEPAPLLKPPSEEPAPEAPEASAAAAPEVPPAPEPAEDPPPAEAPSPATPAEPSTPPSPPAEDAPLVEARPSLLPPIPEEGWSLPTPAEPEAPRGRTLRPDDPSLSPEVLRAEEHARVSERVQTFAEDDLARLRVENGLVHPYFSQLRASLEKQMEDAPLFEAYGTTGQKLTNAYQRAIRNYMKQAERYGGSGTTGRAPTDRSPPTASERLEAISRGNPAHDRMRAFLAAGEAVQELAESSPELIVIVEMQQALDGQLSSVKVVEPSGNKAFDKYVLEAVPPALVRLTPPPPEAIGRRTQGIRTLWAIEGRVMYLKRLSELKGEDAWYVASAAGLGVLAGRFEETTGDIYVIDLRNPSFEVRPRLLRLW